MCSDAQRTLDFYRGELGFTLVKKTVNFDDPHSYHLYFGDAVGAPGTLLTFFEWPRAETGRIGRGTLDWLGLATPAVTAPTELAAAEEHGGAMGLDLAKDDAQLASADGDLAGPRMHDVECANGVRKLSLVPRQRPLRQRPRHFGERDAQRVRRSRDREGRSRLCVTRAAGERERYCNQRNSTTALIVKMTATTIVTRVRLRSTMCVPPCDCGVKPIPASPESRPECIRISPTSAAARRTWMTAKTGSMRPEG